MSRPVRSDAAPYALLAVTCLLGFTFKAHCGAAWVDGVQYTTGCYSDAVPFWGLRGLSDGHVPYLSARMEYPVLTGFLIWLEAGVARTVFGPAATAAHFLWVVTAVNAALAFLVLRMMWAAGVDRPRLLAWAAAPPLVLYLGHNWDLLAATLAVAAVLAARATLPVKATALAALGAAAKLFPVLLLPLLGLKALFAPAAGLVERLWRATRLVLVALLAWGLVNVPVALLAPQNWAEFYAFSSQRSGTAASAWELAGTLGWWQSDIAARNLWSFVLFAGGAAAIVALGWRRHGARPWLLFTPVLAWFLLTNKVYSPQFDLWLYPFLVLTSRRLWPVAWFAAGDVLAYFAEFWMFAGMEGRWPATTTTHIALAAAVRGAAMLWVIVDAVRRDAPAWVDYSAASRPSAA